MVRNGPAPTPTSAEDTGTNPIQIKGKVSLKYEKTQQEIMQEKMMAEIAEKERKAKEERA